MTNIAPATPAQLFDALAHACPELEDILDALKNKAAFVASREPTTAANELEAQAYALRQACELLADAWDDEAGAIRTGYDYDYKCDLERDDHV